MDPINPLSQLAIDFWYKAMLVLCTVLLIVGLTMDVKIIGNLALIELATGGILISLGEWINHPYQERLQLDHLGRVTGKATGYLRKPKPLGKFYNAAGIVLIILGCYQIYRVLH